MGIERDTPEMMKELAKAAGNPETTCCSGIGLVLIEDEPKYTWVRCFNPKCPAVAYLLKSGNNENHGNNENQLP